MERLRFTHEDFVNGASWNGAESAILTWSDDGTARMWDAASGAERLRFTHEGWVNGARWNRAGSAILTRSFGGTARLWDAATGTALFTLTGDGSPVVTTQWSQDERRILFVTQNGFAGIFYIQMADLLTIGCEQYATHNFTWQEWQLYFPGQPYRVTCPQWPVHPTVPEEFRSES
ncbi:MAG: hypothetical protein IPK53_09265 [bacterium]|nr:hypothetical protein [bacterium]